MCYRDELYLRILKIMLAKNVGNIPEKDAIRQLTELRVEASNEIWQDTVDRLIHNNNKEYKRFNPTINLRNV